jgi:hypothetical protein
MQPISSCDPAEIAALPNPNDAPRFNQWKPNENADAPMLFVDIIDNGASMYDVPAMPQDVHELAQLFTTRPEIW